MDAHPTVRSGPGLRLLQISLLVLFALSLGTECRATRGVLNYPKVAVMAGKVGEMTSQQMDSVSWFDVIVMQESPWIVSQIRQRNPDATLLFPWMPQNIVSWSEGETFWYPDTTWSITRLAQFYALKNDWFLRDTSGQRISEWSGYAANWTRYCKRGVYGTSRGLTYPEWLIQVALPQIVHSSWAGGSWGSSSTAYQGLFFEVLADCVGSYGWERYKDADPDGDGLPEGVYRVCSQGGDQDSLSILYREQNELFHAGLWDAVGTDLILVLNTPNPFISPDWWTDMTGIKLESWLTSPPHPPWQDWSDWFYGQRDYSGQTLWGPGYLWAEWNVQHRDIDPLEGWDMSFLQVMLRSNWSEEEQQRRKRFGLGTTLLGDGYFMYTRYQREPRWEPEFDYDLGVPLGPFTRETYPGGSSFADTLYVRTFSRGFVEVNPKPFELHDVSPEDASIQLWREVSDLSVTPTGLNALQVRFTAPDDDPNPVDAFELRYATFPLNAENFDSGTPVEQLLTGVPGALVSKLLIGLDPRLVYWVAVKNIVHERRAPGISNVDSMRILDDDGPPGPSEVGDAPAGAEALRIDPNPTLGPVQFRLRQARSERPFVEIVDPAGRVVARCALSPTSAGTPEQEGVEFQATWDGRDAHGRLLPTGVYWARYHGGSEPLSRRFVIAR